MNNMEFMDSIVGKEYYFGDPDGDEQLTEFLDETVGEIITTIVIKSLIDGNFLHDVPYILTIKNADVKLRDIPPNEARAIMLLLADMMKAADEWKEKKKEGE